MAGISKPFPIGGKMLAHLQIKLEHIASCGTALLSGTATLLGYLPTILGCVASTAAIAWIGVQFYWAHKDRKAAGK